MNVAQVKHMRESVKKNVDVESLASGMNKRKMLEQASTLRRRRAAHRAALVAVAAARASA